MYNRKTIDKNGKGEIIMLTMPISFEELQELFHTKEDCLKFEEMLEPLYGKDILCFYKNGSYPLRDSQSFDSVGNAHDYSVISLTDLFDENMDTHQFKFIVSIYQDDFITDIKILDTIEDAIETYKQNIELI